MPNSPVTVRSIILLLDQFNRIEHIGRAMIKTVDELVDVLGGLKAAAEAFHVGKPSICNWAAAGRLPAWAMVRASELASANRFALDPRMLRAKKPKFKRKAA